MSLEPGMIYLLHPDSPGMRVQVPNRWWNRRRTFATLGQTLRFYERKRQEEF